VIVLTASDQAILERLLAHIDHAILRAEGVAAALRGSKVWITVSVLT
jgi:hypothetical protein